MVNRWVIFILLGLFLGLVPLNAGQSIVTTIDINFFSETNNNEELPNPVPNSVPNAAEEDLHEACKDSKWILRASSLKIKLVVMGSISSFSLLYSTVYHPTEIRPPWLTG